MKRGDGVFYIGTGLIINMAKEVRYFSTFRSNNLVINL